MTHRRPFRYFRTGPEIIRLAVNMYVRLPRFRRMRSLHRFASIHAPVHNHCNLDRALYSRTNFMADRAAAPAELPDCFIASRPDGVGETETGSHLSDSTATCPRESVLPIRLRPDFSVVFEGYAGGAVNRPSPQEARKHSLRADILWTC